jgi:DNA-binding transcriptional LysR family regulator
MSHALTRLRYMLKDDLFIRSPKGILPTPRAEQLALPIRVGPRRAAALSRAQPLVSGRYTPPQHG